MICIQYKAFDRIKQVQSAITNNPSAGIASLVYGHVQPLSTHRNIVLVTKTVVEKKSPPTRE